MDFEQLCKQYSPMIHKIYHSNRIYQDQEEFFQIGLIALWEASQRYDHSKGPFASYAYRFIRGRMLTYLSKRNGEVCSFLKMVPLENGKKDYPFQEDHYFEKEQLLSHFHYLTEREKNWVILHFLDGLNNQDIAQKENLNINSVRSLQLRAMRKFVRKY